MGDSAWTRSCRAVVVGRPGDPRSESGWSDVDAGDSLCGLRVTWSLRIVALDSVNGRGPFRCPRSPSCPGRFHRFTSEWTYATVVDTCSAVLEKECRVKGGVILFRGSGADARRYLESNRSSADEYYLEGGSALAEFSVVNGSGEVVGVGALTPEEYASWVDWINPLANESMGTPREAGDGRQGSPRFAEMVVNAPSRCRSRRLCIQRSRRSSMSLRRMRRRRSAVGSASSPSRRQEVVPVEQLETVSVVHKTSRAGDPHRHIHFQIGTHVWAAGAWRGLDTAALFKQQGAVRALGTAAIAAHPQLSGARPSWPHA